MSEDLILTLAVLLSFLLVKRSRWRSCCCVGPLHLSWSTCLSPATSPMLLTVCWETWRAPPQPWHTYGCAVLEELHYLSNFSRLQLQCHGVTSVKGSEKNKKPAKNRTDRKMRMKWSVAASCNPSC